MNSNLHNLLNVIAEDESYLDIDVIAENAPLKTSKLFVYCIYPYLADCLEISDLIILDGTESSSFVNLMNNSETSHALVEDTSSAISETPLSYYDLNDNLNVCNFCGKTFANCIKLSSHLYDCHTNNLPCSLCDKTFSKKSNLSRHMLTHNSIINFECTICHTKLRSQQV